MTGVLADNGSGMCEDGFAGDDAPHEWEPRRNLLRYRVSPLAGHNLFTPAQMLAIPIPLLVGVSGVKGFILEHLKPKILCKAVCNVMPEFTGAMIRGLWRNQDLLAHSVQI